MLVLALDTCLTACSVAVTREGEVLGWASEPMARGHQERVASMAREVMAAAGVAFADLDRIGVTVGPGSFTGLRVGLAFAKGLGLALGRPCVGVGALEALAASSLDPEGGPEARAPGADAIAAVIDAGRGRVYLQLFEGARALTGPDVLSLETATARLVEVFPWGEARLIGPGAQLLAGVLAGGRLDERPAPDPIAVARLASMGPATPARPLYLRPPDVTAKAA
jgi:tRNA threonylcarbamoyladenosine biosynthesis protein TsaB